MQRAMTDGIFFQKKWKAFTVEMQVDVKTKLNFQQIASDKLSPLVFGVLLDDGTPYGTPLFYACYYWFM